MASKFGPDARNCPIWNVRVGADYFIANRDETRTVRFPHKKGECCVCDDDSGLEMKCGHFICPDDLLDWTWKQIKRLKYEISCANCRDIISMEDIIKFGLPKEDEQHFLDTAISINFCGSQDIQQCPSCQSFCQRIQGDKPRVICTLCTSKKQMEYAFCWYCLRQWINGQNQEICGRDGCRRKEIELLRNCPKIDIKDKAGTIVAIPKFRACPSCFTLAELKSGCHHVTCGMCNDTFCFICLTNPNGGSLVCRTDKKLIFCNPAPVQTKLWI